MLRVRYWSLLLFVLVTIPFASGSVNADPVYPLTVGPTGRYLVDQNGTPFLMAGESPQAMIGDLSLADANVFFANRVGHGFNTVLIDLLCAAYTGCPSDGTTFDGIAPFLATLGGPTANGTTAWDLTTPNPAYFARADAIVQLAAQYGLLVLFDPIETGSWLEVLQANGTTRARAFGQFVGQRYRDQANIVWFHGNDYGPPHADLSQANDDLVTAVALGIRDVDANHLHTVLFNTNSHLPPVLSTDNLRWLPIIDLNAAYTYQATYDVVLAGYEYTPAMPVFMAETGYEFESLAVLGTSPRALRAQEYWALLSGATGQVYGNRYTWPFLDGWTAQLNSPGAVQMAHLMSLFSARRWYDLVPDQGHAVVTAGLGTFGDADYVTAASTPDGGLTLAYVPSARTIAVDLTQMAATVTARWYDPSDGSFTSVPGSPFDNSDSMDFTTPGSNSDGDQDWILVLEAQVNAVPVLASMSPTQVTAGGDDFTLTVNGSSFDPGSVVRVNGSSRATSFVSPSKLTATITAADIASGGSLSITVFTPSALPSQALTLSVRNPAPTLVALDATRTLAGANGFTLTVSGTGFVPSSVVRWKGAARATSFVSSTQLTAGILTSDLAAAGTAAVTVFTPPPGGGTTASITFRIDAPGKVAFTAASTTVDETVSSITLTVTRTAGVGGPVTVDYATADGSAHDGVDYQARSGTLTFGVGDTSRTITVPIVFTSGGSSTTFTVGLGHPTGGLTLGTIPVATVVIRNAVTTLTSFTPTSGPVGTVVTLTGANLPLATSVGFGAANTSGITILSPTTIRVTVPDGATTAPIGILSPAGNPASTAAFRVLPKIISVTPDEGEVGDTVTLTGSNLGGATAVKFGAALAAINGSSYSSLIVTVPGSATTGLLSVTTPDGTASSPAPFVVVRAPTITSFTPATAPEGGTVTISGANLASVSTVSFNGVTASPITVLSATSVRVAVPGGATTGPLTATNVAGAATSASAFKVAPRIVSVTPAQGTPGTVVVITGTTLSAASLAGPGATVRFGATLAGNVSGDSTSLTAFVPTTAASGRITVTTPSGTATSATDFVVIGPPTVTSFAPAAGPVGSAVTIMGTNLGTVTNATVNGVDAGPVTVLSPTSVRITIPGGATTGKIGVTNPNTSTISAATFTLTPAITGLSSTRGEPGTSVTISGTTLGAASLVRFGIASTAVTGNSSTQLTVTVPPSATSGPVTVVTPTGTTASATSFTVVRVPSIASFSPARAPVGGTVTITGANVGTATDVTFAGASGDVSAGALTVLSASAVRVVVPAGAVVGPLHVSNEAGVATSTLAFTPTPRILSLVPGRGLPGTTPITIAGFNLDSASVVKFGAVVASGATVDPGGQQITVTVPASAATGKVSVTTPAGTATSLTDFVVIRPPAIASFSPASGPEGTLVTMTGANLAGASSVAFSGANTTAITILSASSIRVAVPAGAATGRIGVADELGSALSAATFTVTPRIVSIPAADLPGAAVVIAGTSLGNASVVRFGGVTAAGFTVDGPTQITATVPASALSGKITVTTPAGTATSPSDFTVIRLPVVASFTPASAQVGALVTLSGSNLGTVTSVAFGNASTTTITVLSATSIRVAVPAGAVTARLGATNPAGSAQSAATFVLAPKLTGFDVASGADDDTVSLLGSGLAGTILVKFGTVSAAFTVVSDVEISAIVPAAAVTGRVSVTTPGGTTTSPADFVVTAPDPT